MKHTRRSRPAPTLAAFALATVLGACGGGGGGGSSRPATETAAAASAAPSTALSAFQVQGTMPSNFRPIMSIPADAIDAAAASLPSAVEPTYLKTWFTDPADGSVRVLSLGRWTRSQVSPPLQPPSAVQVLSFELYNASGSVAGQWNL